MQIVEAKVVPEDRTANALGEWLESDLQCRCKQPCTTSGRPSWHCNIASASRLQYFSSIGQSQHTPERSWMVGMHLNCASVLQRLRSQCKRANRNTANSKNSAGRKGDRRRCAGHRGRIPRASVGRHVMMRRGSPYVGVPGC